MFDLAAIKDLFKTAPNKAYFWSGLGKDGSKIAEEVAKANGGTTLEMLMERNKDALINAGFPYDIDTDSFMWDPSDSSNKQAWSDLSALYATQASGNVHIVAGDNVTKESVWRTTEMPTLMKNLDVSGINGVPIDQIRDLCDSLGGVDNPEVINVVGETLENISYSNTDESVLIKNENEGNDRKNLGTEESKKEISEAEVKEETSDSEGKKEAKEETGDSESKREVKEETDDSKAKQEGKEETGDSEIKKDAKDKLDESATKQDTSEIGKEASESGTKQENVESESDFENQKSNADGTKADNDVSAKKSELTDGLEGEHTSDSSKVVAQADTGSGTNTSSDGSSTTADKGNTASSKQTATDGGSNTTADKAGIDSTNQTTMDTSAETKKSEYTGDGTQNSNTNAVDSASKAESNGDLSNSEGSKINSGKDISDIDNANGSKHTDLDVEKNGVDTSKSKTELSDKSKKFINDVEDATGSKIDTNFSSKTVRKINKALDILDKAGDIMDLVDAAKTIWSAGKLFKSGNEDEAGKVLRDYGFSTLGGMVFSVPLGVLAGAAAINPLLTLILVGIAGYYGSQMGEFISDLLGEILGLYDEAGAYTYPVDPLIFDLNGDGVKTVALADGVHFDFDKNGFAEKIGWVSAEDGLLVRDLDKNGKIDSGRELMGDLTELSDDLLAANGFEALSYFDANADGVIDAKDDIYNELQIWQDKNQNGEVNDGELMSLSEAGIASINLAYENIDVTDESGNGHSQRGTYTKTDGTTSTVEDVWFEKDAANTVVSDTIDKNVLEETDEIAGLPDIQGKRNQYSLYQAGVYLEEAAEMLVA